MLDRGRGQTDTEKRLQDGRGLRDGFAVHSGGHGGGLRWDNEETHHGGDTLQIRK